MRIADVLRRHATVALDSNVLIYIFQQDPIASPLESLFDALEHQSVRGVMASIGVTEVLAGPARAGDDAVLDQTADELQALPNVEIRALDTDTAVDAGRLRAELGLADAIHVATAISAGATALITNDRRVRSRDHLEVIQLTDLSD
jgi:predicted nucleic acid-binding protein